MQAKFQALDGGLDSSDELRNNIQIQLFDGNINGGTNGIDVRLKSVDFIFQSFGSRLFELQHIHPHQAQIQNDVAQLVRKKMKDVNCFISQSNGFCYQENVFNALNNDGHILGSGVRNALEISMHILYCDAFDPCIIMNARCFVERIQLTEGEC